MQSCYAVEKNLYVAFQIQQNLLKSSKDFIQSILTKYET